MAKRDRRGSRSGRKRRAKAGPPPLPEPAKIYPHRVYGPIPLLVREWTDADGTVRRGYQFDPDYQPPLPPGGVRGNPHRQCTRSVFDVPRYFYVDEEHCCVQCRELFVFGAREQKHWYESLGFNFASVAIRCAPCRRQRRSDKALHHAVDDAKRQLEATPDDAEAQLALAEAIVELHARLGRGRLEQAIAAARKAAKLSRERPPAQRALPHYWEARAQAQSGREAKARAAFDSFLELAGPGRHHRQIRVARDWLESSS